MKKTYLTFALLSSALAVSSCVDEIFVEEKPIYDTTPGNEIMFTASANYSSEVPKTKTVYGDTKLDCEYKDDSLVVSAPTDIFLATDLITLTIKYDGKQEQIKCWYTDVASLNFNVLKLLTKLFLLQLYITRMMKNILKM